jgi:CRISPR-associated protein Cmr6
MAVHPIRRPSGPDRRGAGGRDRGETKAARERPPATGARPLYDKAARASVTLDESGNRGLWYDKFCDRWDPAWKGFAGDIGKRVWIEKIANTRAGASQKKAGDAKLLDEAVHRLKMLAATLQGRSFERMTAWRFVTGLGRSHPVENGFAWRHDLGIPYLPGSSLKGLARAFARDWEELPEDQLQRIFGPKPEADLAVGSAVFLDALPVAPVVLEADVMTPHYGPWYQDGKTPGDWHSPKPIPFLTVAPGQTFVFAVLPRNPSSAEDREQCEKAAGFLARALETLGAGAKTAVGYGQFVARNEGKTEAASGAATAASAPQGQRQDNWSGRAAFAYGEPARIIEDRGETLLVRFEDGGEDEVERREVRLR